MPNITVRDIPEDIYLRIKQSAEANRRSINSEILMVLSKGIGQDDDSSIALDAVRRIREVLVGKVRLEDDVLQKIKSEGRP